MLACWHVLWQCLEVVSVPGLQAMTAAAKSLTITVKNEAVHAVNEALLVCICGTTSCKTPYRQYIRQESGQVAAAPATLSSGNHSRCDAPLPAALQVFIRGLTLPALKQRAAADCLRASDLLLLLLLLMLLLHCLPASMVRAAAGCR